MISVPVLVTVVGAAGVDSVATADVSATGWASTGAGVATSVVATGAVSTVVVANGAAVSLGVTVTFPALSAV